MTTFLIGRRPARWLVTGLVAALPLLALAQTRPEAAADLGLPPEAALQQALLQAPQAATASAAWRAESATARQLRLGPYDWVLRAGLQRRSERAGDSFAEREINLERTLRWGDKPALDSRLADQTLALATLQRRLAWQDAALALLGTWFELQRDAQALAHQQTQLVLAEAQLASLRRRVAAGDAPLLAQRLAEGERERTAAALAVAEQRAAGSRQALLYSHPALAPHLPAAGAALATLPVADDRPADSLARQIIEHHPAGAAAAAQVALARLQLSRLQAERRPDPTVGLRLAQERGGAERVMGVTLSLPFGAAQRDARVQSGEATLALAEAQQQDWQARLATEAQRLAAAPARNLLVHARLQAAASAAETSARLTERAQAAGEATLAEALQLRRQAAEAALAADLARVDALEAQARLRVALQGLLPAP